jgi:hypothetical protein
VRRQIFDNRILKNKIKDHKLLVCATCSQDFTRKSSANRHNRNIHLGMGMIVRFVDYIVGRLEGKYVAADPLLFRKNNGINFRKSGSNFASSTHKPSLISYGDTVAGKEDNLVVPNQQPQMQVKDNRYDFSDLDYTVDLVSKVLRFKNLLSMQQPHGIINGPITQPLWNNTYGLDVSALLAQQFDIDCFFGYSGEVCPCCAYFAIYRLEFRDGSIHNRIWSANHKCNQQASAIDEKESKSTQYVKACDSMPFYLIPIVKRWLKRCLCIFAIKLPQLFDTHKGLIEITHAEDPSKSICVPFSKEEIVTRATDNRKYWAARAVANEDKPTPISEEELLNFLLTVGGSTFGVFNICSRALLGWRSEYYLIYLGKAAAAAHVHTDI